MRELVLCAPLALCPACYLVPDRGVWEQPDRHGMLVPSDVAGLEPGQATRADVFCTLGEPDRVFDDGARAVYHTRVVRWVWFVYLVMDGIYVEFGDDEFHCFHFDEHGLLDARWMHEEGFSGTPSDLMLEEEVERLTRQPASASTMTRP